MRHILMAAVCATGLSGGAAAAAELTFGIGAVQYHFGGPSGVQIDIEARTDPFARLGPNALSWELALTANDTGSAYIGVGIGATADLGRDWFVHSSVGGGYYQAGNAASELGSDFEFRLAASIGRELAGGTRISLGWVHLSNAGTGRFNPGADSLGLRLTRSF